MRTFFIAVAIGVGIGFSVTGQTMAHVLLADDTGKIGAVLHISPDDDPIAGEPSSIFFDIQSKELSDKKYAFSLIVTGEDSQKTYLPITVGNGNVSAAYAFPAQGAYDLILSAEAVSGTGETIHFRHMQRVARGHVAASAPRETNGWAEAGLVGGTCGLLVIGIIVFNKRDLLAAYIKKHKS